MNYLRNIIGVGDAKGITIPKSVLDAYKSKTGHDPKHVLIELEIVEL